MPANQPVGFFLNALTEVERKLTEPTPGHWSNDSGKMDFLSQYAEDIHVEGERDPRSIHSVPNVFARPLQFHQALADRDPRTGKINSPVHQALVAQWRGLLAAIALDSWCGFNLARREFTVDPATQGTHGPLHAILDAQLPEPAGDWRSWEMIFCEDQLLGATSPWTLVYTPAEYKTPQRIPWHDERGWLTDPVPYLRGRNAKYELGLLRGWIQRVLDNSGALRADSRAQLAAWKEEIERLGVEAPQLGPAKDGNRAFLEGAVPAVAGPQSDVVLDGVMRRDILVLSREALSAQTRVWGSIWGDQVDTEKLAATGSSFFTKSGAEEHHEYICPEILFFPQKLAQLSLFQDALSCPEDADRQYATPLTPEYLNYCGAQTLDWFRSGLSIAKNGKTITAKLSLPVRRSGCLSTIDLRELAALPRQEGHDEDPRFKHIGICEDCRKQLGEVHDGGDVRRNPLIVRKEYEQKSDIVKSATPPALAVWPDFCSVGWYANFAICDQRIRTRPSEPPVDLLAAPVHMDGGLLTRANPRMDKRVRIWESPEPILGFGLFCAQPDDKLIPCGLVLRGGIQGSVKREPGKAWSVGVDFGTSSTTVMYREIGRPVQLLPFKNRARFLTDPPDALRTWLERRFLPCKDIYTPFPTALSRDDDDCTFYAQGAQRRVLDYVPRFSVDIPDAGKLVDDLKWPRRGGQTAEVTPREEYLKALLRLVCCEAWAAGAGKVSFSWSYPLALHPGPRQDLAAYWQNLNLAFCDRRLLHLSSEAGTPESDAACRALLQHTGRPSLNVSARALCISIDIGGGSTDIAFWKEKRLLDEVSAKLGGNDILHEGICGNEEFLNALSSACGFGGFDHELYQALTKGGKKWLHVVINKLLSEARGTDRTPYNGDPRVHPVVVGMGLSSAKPWVWIRSLAYLFTAGVSFYAGAHAGKAGGRYLDENGVQIYFGGRGSSLLNWVTNNTAVLRQIVWNAFWVGAHQDRPAGPPTGSCIIGPPFSPGLVPKQEVAAGVLYPSSTQDGQTADPAEEMTRLTTTAVGETDLSFGDQKLAFTDHVAAETLAKLPIGEFDSKLIWVLLRSVMVKNWTGLNVDEERLSQISLNDNEVEQHVRDQGDVNTGTAILQPVFFTELALAMGTYVSLVSKSGMLDGPKAYAAGSGL